MKVEDLKVIINNIEQRFAVDEWEIDGIKLWPFIRIENYMLLSYKVLGARPLSTRSYKYGFKIIKSKINYIYARFFDVKKEASLKRADIVFLSDGMSYVYLRKKWYNKFCDPIASEFSARGFASVRLDLSHNFFTPRYSPSVFIQPIIDNTIISLMIHTKLKKPIFLKENWSDFEIFCEDVYVLKNLISLPSKDVLRKRVAKINKLKKFYIGILKRIQPKMGFVVNYYGDDQMAFILACKDLNIPTFDIQHGVQGTLHLSYGSWFKNPPMGYSQMPNYFWVWSQNEKEAIDQWSKSINYSSATVVGNLFSEMWKDNSTALVTEFDKQFEKLKTPGKKKSILITLSPLTDHLMSETWGAMKKMQYDYNLFIRVHPAMVGDINAIKQDILKLGINEFNIIESSCLPLQTILRNVEIHVTCQSSCIIEAADFGVKSIITCEYGQSLYKDQINSRNAIFVKSADDIIKTTEDNINLNNNAISNLESLTTKNRAIEDVIRKYLV